MGSRLWTAQQASSIDRCSCAASPESAMRLMEEAGQALALKVFALRQPYQNILILAGRGNNGGDALVLARLLLDSGLRPCIVDCGGGKESHLRRLQRERCAAHGLTLSPLPLPPGFGPHSLIIDGVCGLGLSAPGLRAGVALDSLRAAATLGARTVLAIDLPSGLHADDWSEPDIPLRASHTLTFGAPKPVHLLAPASLACGIVSIAPLSFDPGCMQRALDEGYGLSLADERFPDPWLGLSAAAHKYTRGHVLVVGGSRGKVGAIYLAAEAAMRMGCGWVSVAALDDTAAPARPSFLTYEDDIWEDPRELERFLKERRVKGILIGPGCVSSPLSSECLALLSRWNREEGLGLVFDAGALLGWAAQLPSKGFDPNRTLLTPHPGEWLKLGLGARALDSLAALEPAWDFCRKAGVTVFYKTSTPFSLSCKDDKASLTLTTSGDSRLAKAGSGDVLAGAALALLAAGVPAAEAGYRAQTQVAHAARLASKSRGYHGLSAADIAAYLGQGGSF